MSRLFEKNQLGTLSLNNRIIVAPMCQYSAIDGHTTDWHTVHLGGLALGNPGLVILEATGVVPEGRISPNCLGLWDDATEASLTKTIRAVQQVAPNTPLAIQLSHAGRKGSGARPWEGGRQVPLEQGGWQTKAPSAIPFSKHDHVPEALTLAEIQHIVQAFGQAAARAVRAGLQAIEIHAAHGYLLHQFLSPLSNQRTDQYGGSLENRMRLVLEVFTAIQQAVPQGFPVGIRISATDWVADEPSWTLDQSITLITKLQAMGLTWVDVSSGALSTAQKIPVGPGYQVPFAQAIKQATGATTMAVGLITEPEHAESILQQGQADYIAIARGFIYNPRWVWHAARALGVSVPVAKQYLRGHPHSSPQLFI